MEALKEKLGKVSYARNPSAWEVRAGGSGVLRQPQLPSEFNKAILGYVRPYLNKQESKPLWLCACVCMWRWEMKSITCPLQSFCTVFWNNLSLSLSLALSLSTPPPPPLASKFQGSSHGHPPSTGDVNLDLQACAQTLHLLSHLPSRKQVLKAHLSGRVRLFLRGNFLFSIRSLLYLGQIKININFIFGLYVCPWKYHVLWI